MVVGGQKLPVFSRRSGNAIRELWRRDRSRLPAPPINQIAGSLKSAFWLNPQYSGALRPIQAYRVVSIPSRYLPSLVLSLADILCDSPLQVYLQVPVIRFLNNQKTMGYRCNLDFVRFRGSAPKNRCEHPGLLLAGTGVGVTGVHGAGIGGLRWGPLPIPAMRSPRNLACRQLFGMDRRRLPALHYF